MRRISAALATVLTASGLAVAGPATTAQAKTYTGPSDVVLNAISNAAGSRATLFDKIPVTGVPTLVKAAVTYKVNSDAPIDTKHGTLISLSLICPDASTGAAQNIVKGKPLTFRPFLLTKGKAGDCKMSVRAETGTGHTWSKDPKMKVTVTSSKVTVLKAAPGAKENRPKNGSALVDVGEDINVAEVTTKGPNRWVAQAKMTGCTGLNGSRDGKGPQLCETHVDGKASATKVRVVVQRRCAAGAGATKTLYSENVTITRATHHYTWFASGTTVPACASGSPRLKLYMKHTGGPAFVAHRGFPGNAGVTAIAAW